MLFRSLTVTVDSAGSGTITNTAQITTSTPDSDPGNNEDEEPTTVQEADVAITKSDSPAAVTVGEVLTYTLVYINNGPGTAADVVITELLPGEVSFGGVVNETPDLPGGPNVSGSVVTWSVGSLASGAGGSIVLTVTVDSAGSGTITNTAQITKIGRAHV